MEIKTKFNVGQCVWIFKGWKPREFQIKNIVAHLDSNSQPTIYYFFVDVETSIFDNSVYSLAVEEAELFPSLESLLEQLKEKAVYFKTNTNDNGK